MNRLRFSGLQHCISLFSERRRELRGNSQENKMWPKYDDNSLKKFQIKKKIYLKKVNKPIFLLKFCEKVPK